MVPARRIIAVSPDDALRQQLEAALGAAFGDAVEAHAALDALGADEPPAALLAIHLDGELAGPPGELLPGLPGACPVIAILPRPDLAAAVEIMQASPRVAGVLAAVGADPDPLPDRLAAMAARILGGDVFGLDKAMPPGTQIHTQVVGDHQAKSLFLLTLSELMEQANVQRRYRAPIEQCVDELLMNALYDAPVDEQGRHIFAGIPARIRVTLRSEHSVVVEYASDGKQLGVAVRDAFGTLDREVVLRHLHKGLHAEQKVDRKAGGAGLGLYLIASSATAVHFNVLPGIATEVICAFDLEAPKLQLQQLGFVVQHDAGGRRAAGPARRLPAGPRPRRRVATAAIAAIAVAAALVWGGVLWRRGGRSPDRSGQEAPAVPTLELDSQPPGAAVEIDGAAAGSTPLTLTALAPGTTVSIAFKRIGYRPATARLEVPRAGEVKRHVQPLEPSDDYVRVRFVSKPPGAEVTRIGQPATIDRTYTPAELFVEANQAQRFLLTMPGHVPLVIEPFTPARGTRELEKGGELVPGANLRIEAPPGGRATVSGAPHCTDVALPIDCTLAPGKYVVEYRGPGGAKARRTVTMGTQSAIERF